MTTTVSYMKLYEIGRDDKRLFFVVVVDKESNTLYSPFK